ncbi:Aste57867_24690 [Aphanomyces stellatus]|uniref:Aste57867_24690 protein n=1 Tax=Aphanomyces stellatus TaxID=120398 RepID=A0A485LVD2_9STRA|nr:hypothetical protein As57867_024612 [Aphanomyces stellatus]VFU01327.1 Aste57867_24690 [Aphanomyces stellatus]
MQQLTKQTALAPANEELVRLRAENAMLRSQLLAERQTNLRLLQEQKSLQHDCALSPLDIRRLKAQLASTKKELTRTKTKVPRSGRERRLLRDYRTYMATNPSEDMVLLCAKAVCGHLKPSTFVHDLVLTQLKFFASTATFQGGACTKYPPKIMHWCETVYLAYGRRAYELLSGELKASTIGNKRAPSSWNGHLVLPSVRRLQRHFSIIRDDLHVSSDPKAPNYLSNRDLLQHVLERPPPDDELPASSVDQLAWLAALMDVYKTTAPPPDQHMQHDMEEAVAQMADMPLSAQARTSLALLPPCPIAVDMWPAACTTLQRLCEEQTNSLGL